MRKTQANSAPATPCIQLDGLTFTYMGSGLPIWEGLSCSFPEGGVHVVAGPSGCGKSTMLQAIDGLVPHVNEGEMTGRVLFRGEDVTQVEPRQRCSSIGYVMQDPDGQFCTFTVEEEVAFGPENLGIPREDVLARVDRALHDVGMGEYRARNLAALSGGQKQKVAIASVLAMEPQVLLLDEPTANLDPASRREVLHLVVRLARERSMTVIMVEHNLEDVLAEIDTLTVMDGHGNVVVQAPLEEAVQRLQAPDYADLRAYLPSSLWGPHAIESMWGHDEVARVGDVVLRARDLVFAYPISSGLWKKTFGPRVLDGVSLDVHERDFLAIAGRNGAGKSTLFDVIFRLYEPQSGSIELFGRDVRTLAKRDIYRSMGLVFQNPELQFVTNQVDEELLASLKDEDIPQDQKEQRVLDMLGRYGLREYAHESPFVLSQGQKRRLSVATMLITNQRILFLDEPTYGQDQQNRVELMDQMVELNRGGVAIVMITHDLELIERYAKRVVCLDGGRVVFQGSPEDYVRFAGEARRAAGEGPDAGVQVASQMHPVGTPPERGEHV